MAGPFPGLEVSGAVDNIAHVVQVALTPVFLLSGIGTLLNMFNTRQARVSDHAEHTTELLRTCQNPTEQAHMHRHLRRLGRRMLAMDAAVVMGALGGASTCGAACALFLGGLRDSAIASWLLVLFGGALVFTVGALVAFLVDSVLAWHGLRRDGPMPPAKATTRG